MTTAQQHKSARLVTVFALTALLAACGGGGEGLNAGGSAPNSAPNSPPNSAPNASPVPVQVPSANPVPAGFEPITTLAKQAVANTKYFVQTIKAAATDEVVIALPTTIPVGATVVVKGDTDIRWKLAQSAGQTMGTRVVPGGVEPGLAFSAQQSTTQNWWFVASSASGQKLAAVANNFSGLQAPGSSASGSVWTSADAGATWTEQTAPGNAPWSSIASSADGTKLAAVGLGTQVWTSGDSGATWIARATNRSWDSVTVSADGSRIAAATLETNAGSGDGRIYTLEQAGAVFGAGVWIERSEVQMWRSIASSADGKKLVAAAHRDGATSTQGGGVFTSNDYGVTWTPRTSLAVSAYRVASSSDGSRLVMAERFGKIYTSIDAGVTWSAGTFEGGFNSVASSADGSVLLAVQANGNSSVEGAAVQPGRTGKMLVSTNAGATWTERATPNKWWRGAAVSADGNRLVGAVNVGQIFVSTSNRSSYGTTGSVTGGQTNEITLRYLGDGLFDVTSASGAGYVTR